VFHIFFCANENYIKFAAVMINNIINKTNLSLKFEDFYNEKHQSKELKSFKKLDLSTFSNENEKYIFHILSDKISNESAQKLISLEKNLNEIYPCEIKIHQINDIKYQNTFAYKGNFVANFILEFDTFLPDNVQNALALDLDMFVNCDLRELFSLDLKGFVLSAANNYTHKAKWFNTGFVLFNARAYKEQNIQQKVIEYIKAYKPDLPDQAALNICCKAQTLFLPFVYNFCPHTENEKFGTFIDESAVAAINLSRAEFEALKREAKIIHFLGCAKPWDSVFSAKEVKISIYRKSWWGNALKTPIFQNELGAIFENLMQNELDEAYLSLEKRLINIENTLQKDMNSSFQKTGALIIFKNSLEYQLGLMMMSLKGGHLRRLLFFFKARKFIKKYEKNQELLAQITALNPALKPLALEQYADFNEAMKLKRHLTYRLGALFLKSYKQGFKQGYFAFLKEVEAQKLKF